MNNIKKLLVLLVAIICCGCSGKLLNEITCNCLFRDIECYFSDFKIRVSDNVLSDFRIAMEVLYYKYPETHITLDILQQLEKTDTVLNMERPSLKTLQYSSQKNYAKLASRDNIPMGPIYRYIYRLKSHATGNVFVFTTSGCLTCVFIASDNYKPCYLKDFTFKEEKAIEQEFEAELLPKIKECIAMVKERNREEEILKNSMNGQNE